MLYSHCPSCGHKYTEQKDPNAYTCSVCGFVFYQNSKPTVGAVIAKDGKILLGKRKIEPSKGQWSIIGGFLNLGEDPESALKREVKEETGLDVEVDDFIGIFMDSYGTTGYATLNIYYTAKILAGNMAPGDDVNDLKWFAINDIPQELAFKNVREMIDAWLEKLKS